MQKQRMATIPDSVIINSDEIACRFLEGTALFTDIVFGLSEESNDSPDNLRINYNNYDDNDSNSISPINVEENKAFWETQEQLLQASICRSSPVESKIRRATKDALHEIKSDGVECVCRRPVIGGVCRICLQREMSVKLQDEGYDCFICKSKWKCSSDIPSGEHTYLEVVDNMSSKKGEVIRVIIDLNFRAEFEMARGSEDYNNLISRLPEVFVGKTERLKPIIKVVCAAAKKCMKDKNMHLGPWRKQKYMQAKWLGTCCERTTSASSSPLHMASPERQQQHTKPKASMLTFDLLSSGSNLHFATAAVKVI